MTTITSSINLDDLWEEDTRSVVEWVANNHALEVFELAEDTEIQEWFQGDSLSRLMFKHKDEVIEFVLNEYHDEFLSRSDGVLEWALENKRDELEAEFSSTEPEETEETEVNRFKITIPECYQGNYGNFHSLTQSEYLESPAATLSWMIKWLSYYPDNLRNRIIEAILGLSTLTEHEGVSQVGSVITVTLLEQEG